MDDFTSEVFLNGVDFNTIFSSDDFLNKYSKYKEKTNINDLIDFLDNIETNKKYYRMNIHKNKRYKQVVTEDTSSIKTVNSMINRLTEINYEILKPQILEKINKDYIIPYIIESIFEKSILHHRYINLYVGILKDMNNCSPKTQKELNKMYYKYYNILFNDRIIDDDRNDYQRLCDKNKKTDNIIGFSLLITYLEKEKVLKGYIEKVLEPFLNCLSDVESDIELYQRLLSFENISKIYFTIIPKKYLDILRNLQDNCDSPKIRFKIMDILGE
jgi:hypothetical protein